MKKVSVILAGLGILGLLAGSNLRAYTVTFQDGTTNPLTGALYDGTEDTYVDDHNANNNYGKSDNIKVRTTYKKNTLVRFNLTSLSGYEVTGATLWLYDEPGDHSRNVELYEVKLANVDWVEGTGPNAGSANPGESCWDYKEYALQPADQVNWAGLQNGCGVANTDYVTPGLDSTWVGAEGWYGWDITRTTMLQTWADDHSQNAGAYTHHFR